jgi:NADPH:quinone reductase-like Zn-dependent oxidoreductase
MLALEDPMLLADTDAIVCVEAVTLCDDAIGTVEAVGSHVTMVEVGDRVLLPSAPTDRVRVPYANTSLCKVPDGATDGELLMLASFFRRS